MHSNFEFGVLVEVTGFVCICFGVRLIVKFLHMHFLQGLGAPLHPETEVASLLGGCSVIVKKSIISGLTSFHSNSEFWCEFFVIQVC